MQRFVIGALAAAAAVTVASPAAAQGQGCSRERLIEIANQYRAAQASGRAIMHMMPMGEWVNYYENFELSSMAFGGVIASPQKVDWDRSFYDTVSCQVYVESVITNPEKPYVLATIIRGTGSPGSPPGTVSGFDVIVSEPHDWLFDASKTLYYAQREDWSDIPEAQRDSRQVLQAAADAYLDLFKDKTVQVPWGTPCARLEGSAYTGKGQPDEARFTRLLIERGANLNIRASIRHRLEEGHGGGPLREYRDVTPLSWGERFVEKIFVSRESLRLIDARGGAR